MPKFFIRIAIAIVALIGLTTAGFASDVWEGVFTQAHQNNGTWTASVFDHASGRQLTKQFEECRRVVQPIHGWACHREVMNFVFADSPSDSNQSASADLQVSNNAQHLSTSHRPSNADVASVPKGWNGVYKFADFNGNTWTATRYDGKSDGPFTSCTAMNGNVICQ